MWECPDCQQKFMHQGQLHSCNDKVLADFTDGKRPEMVELFYYFLEVYRSMGEFKLHPTKSRVGLASRIRFAHLHRIGKTFVDITFTFGQPYTENLCFYRIGEVPGGKIFQHYLRLESKEDLNDEVRKYMKMALESGS